MSTVQEIEATLTNLTMEDLQTIERSICSLKHKQLEREGYEYLLREYGITREEWDRFVQRREQEIEADRTQGRMKLFTGDIEQDLQD